jgi:predicted PurR-regulated permease PerM
VSEDPPTTRTAWEPPEAQAEGRQLAELLTRLGIGAWSIVGVLIALWIALTALSKVRILLAPIVLSIVLVYVLNPIVNWLQQRHVHRIYGSLAAFALLLGGFVLVGFLITPSVSDQARELRSDFPMIFEDAALEIEEIVDSLGFGAVDLWSYEELQDYLSDPEVRDRFLSAAIDRLGALTSGLLEAILVFFVAPVVAFYVLIDLPRVREQTESLVPGQHLGEVIHVSRQLGTAVGGFLRGQVIVALIVGLLMSLGFWIVDLKFWLIIGMVSGFLNIIPFVGPWVGGVLGVMVGFVTSDVETAISAAVVALIVQQIDNNFVSPTVLRATVRLHPAVVLLVLVLGGGIGGLWGVLLAVPVAASLKILVGHLWRTRVLGQSWEEASGALIEDFSDRRRLPSIWHKLASFGSTTTGAHAEVDDVPVDAEPVGGEPTLGD